MCHGEPHCNQPTEWVSASDESMCLGHAIAHNLNMADGLTETLAKNPNWEKPSEDDDARGTMADKMRASIAGHRRSAKRLIAEAA